MISKFENGTHAARHPSFLDQLSVKQHFPKALSRRAMKSVAKRKFMRAVAGETDRSRQKQWSETLIWVCRILVAPVDSGADKYTPNKTTSLTKNRRKIEEKQTT